MNPKSVQMYVQGMTMLIIMTLGVALVSGCDEGEEGTSGGDISDNSQSGAQGNQLSELPFDANAMATMLYECADADEYVYSLQLFAQGSATLADPEGGASVSGSYTLSGETISLSFPDLGLEESARDQQVALGVLGTFYTMSLYCHAVALRGSVEQAEEYICPASNHIQDVSFENDEFYLRANGNVFWRHWDNLVQANDRIYSAQNGIWIQRGDQVAMFFGSPFFETRLMTGILSGGALLIDQLDTSNGACE